MIEQGKEQGWLRLPIETLRPWAKLNGALFNGVGVGTQSGYEDRGSTIISRQKLVADGSLEPLMVVPRDLILSLERVQEHAKCDRDFLAVLDALGDFGRSSRGAILTFLLLQCSLACPSMPEKHGVASPFTEYVKFLPLELLPTFWHDRERCLLKGTTLEAAVQAKLKSLYREFELLRASTSGIQWCADCWWNEVDGQVTFDDWLHIDAMYRSRALEFPGIGACMAPCIDMANHASGEDTAAIYEVDEDGNAVLLLRPGRAPQPGDEITITYGDEKGACEMIFSYGFIEDSMTNAKELFLDLTIPADDPLGRAKNAAANSAPGFKIFDIRDGIDWTGNFIWLLCVNEEDGLEFAIRRTVEGERELGILWKGQEMPHLDNFRAILEQDPMWEVFHLRAVSLLQDRVAIQLQTLYESEDEIQALARNEQSTFRDRTRQLALRLRSLETNMLERAYGHFEDMKTQLAQTGPVMQYLSSTAARDGDEDDFS